MTATVAAPAVGVANDQTAAQPVSGIGHMLVPAFGGSPIHAAPYTNVNANQNAAEPAGIGHALIVLSTHSVIPAPFFGAILGAGGGQVGYAT